MFSVVCGYLFGVARCQLPQHGHEIDQEGEWVFGITTYVRKGQIAEDIHRQIEQDKDMTLPKYLQQHYKVAGLTQTHPLETQVSELESALQKTRTELEQRSKRKTPKQAIDATGQENQGSLESSKSFSQNSEQPTFDNASQPAVDETVPVDIDDAGPQQVLPNEDVPAENDSSMDGVGDVEAVSISDSVTVPSEEVSIQNIEPQPEICPICLEQLNQSDPDVVSIFTCGHLLHFKCVSGILDKCWQEHGSINQMDSPMSDASSSDLHQAKVEKDEAADVDHSNQSADRGTMLSQELQNIVRKHAQTDDQFIDKETKIPYGVLSWLRTNVVSNARGLSDVPRDQFWQDVINNSETGDVKDIYIAILNWANSRSLSSASRDSWDQYRCWCRSGKPIKDFDDQVLNPRRQHYFLEVILEGNRMDEFEKFLELESVGLARARYLCILVACLLNPSVSPHDYPSDDLKVQRVVDIIMNPRYEIRGDIVIDGEGSTLLMMAWRCPALMKALVERKTDVNLTNIRKDTVLHVLLENNSRHQDHDLIFNQAKLLIDNGANVNAVNERQETPLLLAAHFGYRDVVGLLLKKGANTSGPGFSDDRRVEVSDTNQFPSTPLMTAAMKGHDAIVAALIENNARVDHQHATGKTAFHYVIGTHNRQQVGGERRVLTMCKSLCGALAHLSVEDRSEIVNIVDDYQQTPLMLAVEQGFHEVVGFLIENGADRTISNKDGTTPLITAVERGWHEVITVLLKNDHNLDDPQINKRGQEGWTPLMWAAAQCQPAICTQLINAGALVRAISDKGFTSLHAVLKFGTAEEDEILEICRILVDADCKRKTVNTKSSKTPLMRAVEKGYSKVVKFLLEHDADVEVRDNRYWSVFHFAINNKNEAAVSIFDVILTFVINKNNKSSFYWRSILNTNVSKIDIKSMFGMCKPVTPDMVLHELAHGKHGLADQFEGLLKQHEVRVPALKPELEDPKSLEKMKKIKLKYFPALVAGLCQHESDIKLQNFQQVDGPGESTHKTVHDHIPAKRIPKTASATNKCKTSHSDAPAQDCKPFFFNINQDLRRQFMSIIPEVTGSFVQVNASAEDSSVTSLDFDENQPIHTRQIKVKCKWQHTVFDGPFVRPKFRTYEFKTIQISLQVHFYCTRNERCEVQWESFLFGTGISRAHPDDAGSHFLGSQQMDEWSAFLQKVYASKVQDASSFVESVDNLDSHLIRLQLSGNDDQKNLVWPQGSRVSTPFKSNPQSALSARSWSTDHQLHHYGIDTPTWFAIILASMHAILLLATFIYVLWRLGMANKRIELSRASKISLPYNGETAYVSLHKTSRCFVCLSYIWLALLLVSLGACIFYVPLGAAGGSGDRSSFMFLGLFLVIESLLAVFFLRSARIGVDGRRVLTLGIVAAKGLDDATIVLLEDERRVKDNRSRDGMPKVLSQANEASRTRERSNSEILAFPASTLCIRKRSKSMLLPRQTEIQGGDEDINSRDNSSIVRTDKDAVLHRSMPSGDQNDISNEVSGDQRSSEHDAEKPTVAGLLRSVSSDQLKSGVRSSVTMSAQSRLWCKGITQRTNETSVDIEHYAFTGNRKLYLPLHYAFDKNDNNQPVCFFTLHGVRFFWSEPCSRFVGAYFYKDAVCNSFRRWNAKGLAKGDVDIRSLLIGAGGLQQRQPASNQTRSTMSQQLDWCLRELFLRSHIPVVLLLTTFLVPYWSLSSQDGAVFALSLLHIVALVVFLCISLCPMISAMQRRVLVDSKRKSFSCKTFVVQVFRDGQWSHVKPVDMVPGDIFCVPAGMRIPCDAVLLSGAPVVNDSILYGTSSSSHVYAEVAKKPLWNSQQNANLSHASASQVTHENRLYEGTVVIRLMLDDSTTNTTAATAVCTDVGSRTRRGQLTEAMVKSSFDLADNNVLWLDHEFALLIFILFVSIAVIFLTYAVGAILSKAILLNDELVNSGYVKAFVPLFSILERFVLADVHLLVTWLVLFMCVSVVTRKVFATRLQKTGTSVVRAGDLPSAGRVDTVVVTQPDVLLQSNPDLRLNMVLPIYDGKVHFDPELSHDHVSEHQALAEKNPPLKVLNRLKVLSKSTDLHFLSFAAGCSHQYSESGFTGGTASMNKSVDTALYEAGGWRIVHNNTPRTSDVKTKPRCSYFMSPVDHSEEHPLEIIRFLYSDAQNPTSGCIVRCPRTSKR